MTDARPPPEIRLVQISIPRRDLRLAAWLWGEASAPPLMLVHGGRDHSRSWDRVARAFPDRRIVAPDLRGHGDSGWAADGVYAMSDFVGDLVLIADELGLERFDLVGHSLGGNIAWRLAALFPERIGRLCVIEGLGPPPDKIATAAAASLATRMRADVAAGLKPPYRRRVYADLMAAVARVREANPRLDPALALHLAVHGTRPAEGGVVFKHDPGLGRFGTVDLSQAERETLWRAIEVPVLLVHGAESWASNPARDGRAALFNNARTLSLEGAGHSVHHDRPVEFAAALRAFLEKPS